MLNTGVHDRDPQEWKPLAAHIERLGGEPLLLTWKFHARIARWTETNVVQLSGTGNQDLQANIRSDWLINWSTIV